MPGESEEYPRFEWVNRAFNLSPETIKWVKKYLAIEHQTALGVYSGRQTPAEKLEPRKKLRGVKVNAVIFDEMISEGLFKENDG
jgi:hypothetical protein